MNLFYAFYVITALGLLIYVAVLLWFDKNTSKTILHTFKKSTNEFLTISLIAIERTARLEYKGKLLEIKEIDWGSTTTGSSKLAHAISNLLYDNINNADEILQGVVKFIPPFSVQIKIDKRNLSNVIIRNKPEHAYNLQYVVFQDYLIPIWFDPFNMNYETASFKPGTYEWEALDKFVKDNGLMNLKVLSEYIYKRSNLGYSVNKSNEKIKNSSEISYFADSNTYRITGAQGVGHSKGTKI